MDYFDLPGMVLFEFPLRVVAVVIFAVSFCVCLCVCLGKLSTWLCCNWDKCHFAYNGYKYRTLSLLCIIVIMIRHSAFTTSKNSIYSNGYKYPTDGNVCVCCAAHEALSWLMNVWLFKNDIKNPRRIPAGPATHSQAKHTRTQDTTSYTESGGVQCACKNSIFFSLHFVCESLCFGFSRAIVRACRSLQEINKLHVFHLKRLSTESL